jgi:hypothetical protein
MRVHLMYQYAPRERLPYAALVQDKFDQLSEMLQADSGTCGILWEMKLHHHA